MAQNKAADVLVRSSAFVHAWLQRGGWQRGSQESEILGKFIEIHRGSREVRSADHCRHNLEPWLEHHQPNSAPEVVFLNVPVMLHVTAPRSSLMIVVAL